MNAGSPAPRLPEGVGWTSLLTAYGRAQESRRADRLFDDPVARACVETALYSVADDQRLPNLGPATDDGTSTLWTAFCAYSAGRTPFYDRHIQRRIASGCRQLVILAAGLDGRAFRLPLPADTTVYELDHAPVLAFKQAVLADHGLVPLFRRVPLAADLRTDWTEPLREAGFKPDEATVWLAEGTLMYLTAAECAAVATNAAHMSGPGGFLLTEHFDRTPAKYDMVTDESGRHDHETWNTLRAQFRDGPGTEPSTWLPGAGWNPTTTSHLASELRRQNRPVPPEFGRPGAVRIWLTEAVTKE